jgi:hypothetical protein
MKTYEVRLRTDVVFKFEAETAAAAEKRAHKNVYYSVLPTEDTCTITIVEIGKDEP